MISKLLFAVAVAGVVGLAAAEKHAKYIEDRLEKVKAEYWGETQQYWPEDIYPPLKWFQQKGLYSSYVHVNFHGEPGFTALRNGYKFPDSNGFVTLFILQSLLEAHELGTIKIHQADILPSLLAVLEHQDKNLEGSQVPVYNFWNQYQNNLSFYEATPENIHIPVTKGLNGVTAIKGVLEKLGLGSLAEKLSGVQQFFDIFLTDFRIPSDSDDTGCAMALGAKLKSLSAEFPAASKIWDARNANFKEFTDRLVKYSYKPFLKVDDKVELQDSASIDPRTYFWIHRFLETKKRTSTAEDLEGFALVTTWFQHISEVSEGLKKGVRMPFNINNVDASVAANAVFGLTSHFIAYPEDAALENEKLDNLLLSTTELLVWVLQDDVLDDRPDLVLLYYPPIYDFYWFSARIVHLLNSKLKEDNPRFHVLDKIRSQLTPAVQKFGAKSLLRKMETEKESHIFSAPTFYSHWDDFLGNADTISPLITVPRREDRVFSTAVATNALIDSWTISETLVDGKVTRLWLPNTPKEVKDAVQQGVSWIEEKSSSFARDNAFFSASVKSYEYAIPFYYPSNMYRYLNGTEESCAVTKGFSDSHLLVAGVVGVMEEADFTSKLQSTCAGKKVPVDAPGNNCGSCIFPYWSAPSLTYALELLAVSKFSTVHDLHLVN